MSENILIWVLVALVTWCLVIEYHLWLTDCDGRHECVIRFQFDFRHPAPCIGQPKCEGIKQHSYLKYLTSTWVVFDLVTAEYEAGNVTKTRILNYLNLLFYFPGELISSKFKLHCKRDFSILILIPIPGNIFSLQAWEYFPAYLRWESFISKTIFAKLADYLAEADWSHSRDWDQWHIYS